MASSQQARDVIQQVVEKLVAGYALHKVILFGSYAYGDPTPDSDIDLPIIKEM
ncbi:MAG: nucleotidyltransferase domain-containing protein [Anaerolineae bacterium]